MDPMFLIILVVGLGALLFMNWRTKRKQQEQLSFRDQLEPGQQVQTIGGLVGTITAVQDDRVTLETVPGTEVVFVKQALARLVEDPQAFDEDDEGTDTADEDENAEETTEQGEIREEDGSAVVRSPEVADELASSVSPESGDDDTPRSTQN